MKIVLHFKTPDVVDHAIDKAEEDFRSIHEEMDKDELNEEYFLLREALMIAIEKFVKNGEYLSVEIDSVARTAKVLGPK